MKSFEISASAFIAEGVKVIGRVIIKDNASIWYNCVLRGDVENTEIVIGENSNVQDGTVIHNDSNMSTIIGKNVTIGHNCTIHACNIEDNCLIGMSAVVLSGAVIKRGSIVGAGAVVKEGYVVEPNTLVAGIPAKEIKKLPVSSEDHLIEHANNYVGFGNQHKNNEFEIYKN